VGTWTISRSSPRASARPGQHRDAALWGLALGTSPARCADWRRDSASRSPSLIGNLVDAATFQNMRARADEIAPDTTSANWRHNRFFNRDGAVARHPRRRRRPSLQPAGVGAGSTRPRDVGAPRATRIPDRARRGVTAASAPSSADLSPLCCQVDVVVADGVRAGRVLALGRVREWFFRSAGVRDSKPVTLD
jgi:hypothetical protein